MRFLLVWTKDSEFDQSINNGSAIELVRNKKFGIYIYQIQTKFKFTQEISHCRIKCFSTKATMFLWKFEYEIWEWKRNKKLYLSFLQIFIFLNKNSAYFKKVILFLVIYHKYLFIKLNGEK